MRVGDSFDFANYTIAEATSLLAIGLVLYYNDLYIYYNGSIPAYTSVQNYERSSFTGERSLVRDLTYVCRDGSDPGLRCRVIKLPRTAIYRRNTPCK